MRRDGAANSRNVPGPSRGGKPLRGHRTHESPSIARGALNVVGATGFEPATSCSRSRRATGLRYAPSVFMADTSHAPERTRTSNLLIRSQMLYPIELRARCSRASGANACRGRPCMIHTISAAGRATYPGRSTPSTPVVRPPRMTPAAAVQRPHGEAVGPMSGTRLELVTSTMSTWRSNQLS